MKKTATLTALITALTVGCSDHWRTIEATLMEESSCEEGIPVKTESNIYAIQNDQDLPDEINGVIYWEGFGRPEHTYCNIKTEQGYDWKRIPKVNYQS